VRSRRDEWQAAGIFDRIADRAIEGYDRIIGLDFSDVSLDGSVHKVPCGGPGTGPNPTDRAKLGWKWSVLVDADGIPLGWHADGANRHDSLMLEATIDDLGGRAMVGDTKTVWLDRGCDSDITRARLAERGITDAAIARKRRRGEAHHADTNPSQPRAALARGTYQQLDIELRAATTHTDRKPARRIAQFALAVTILLVAKLIDWRNRWSPASTPIR